MQGPPRQRKRNKTTNPTNKREKGRRRNKLRMRDRTHKNSKTKADTAKAERGSKLSLKPCLFPKIGILQTIGLWNIILAVITIIYSAAFYTTSNEDLVNVNDSKKYIPKYKRWNKLTWMKNRANKLLENIFSSIETRLNNHCTKVQRRKRLNRLRQTARRYRQPKLRNKNRILLMLTALAMTTQTRDVRSQRMTSFDTDSRTIGVDNRCSACISNDPSDLITELKPCNKSIKGFGGARTSGVMIGTIKWTWCDDRGKPHSFIIPNS